MNNEASQSNRRIAKNTLLLYLRMFLTVGISLFTSRVVLDKLGAEDFGIYGVVAGFVAIFAQISCVMSGATQRFIIFAMEQGDISEQKQTFNASLFLHTALAVFMILVIEISGRWFILNEMVLPESRIDAALFTLHFSTFAMALSIVQIPFDGIIIAHERMSAFAYLSIFYAVMKLLIAFSLTISTMDHLKLYAALTSIVSVINILAYYIYVKRNFFYLQGLRLLTTRAKMLELAKFGQWVLIGNLSVAGFTQGLNIILNLFFGPVVNAARNIAVQVQNVCGQFCSSFQFALNPQLTKSYADGDLARMHELVSLSSRMGVYLIWMLVLPLWFEAPFVLSVWLVEVPEHTVAFIRIILLTLILSPFANTMIVSCHATGDIKKFQIIEGGLLLTILPVSYLFLYWGYAPESVFIIQLVVFVIVQIVRYVIVLPMIKMSFRHLFRSILKPVSCVLSFSFAFTGLLYYSLPLAGWGGFLVIGFCSEMSFMFLLYFFGMTRPERSLACNKVKHIWHELRIRI